MTMMIGLVGEQPLPNFLAIKRFQRQFNQVLLVYSYEKRKKKEKLENVLTKKLGVQVETLETQAHDVVRIAQRMREKLRELHIGPEQKPVFNLTGGTKAMSLAASWIAQEFDAQTIYVASQERDVYVYRSTWKDNRFNLDSVQKIPVCITLEDIFDMHLGWVDKETRNWKEHGPSKDEGGPFEKLLARILEEQGDLVNEVMSSVKTLNNQIDIDIAIRLGNHYGLIEAKSGENGKKLDGVKQLAIALPLFSTYARPFYVITTEATSKHEPVKDALGITSISLESYDRENNIISDHDVMKLISRIKHAFEVPGVFIAND